MLQRQEASILQLIQEIEELVLELTTKQKLKNSRYMYFQIHEIREKIQTANNVIQEQKQDFNKDKKIISSFLTRYNHKISESWVRENTEIWLNQEIQELHNKYSLFAPNYLFQMTKINEENIINFNIFLKKFKFNLKNLQEKLNDQLIRLNKINILNEKQQSKTFLEKAYFCAAIILGSLPLLSLLGFIILLIILNKIGLQSIFIDVANDLGGLWFSVVLGLTIGITQFVLPIWIIYSSDIFKNENRDKGILKILSQIQKYSSFFLVLVMYIPTWVFSFVGFYLFFDEKSAMLLSINWLVFIVFLQYVYFKFNKKNDFSSKRIMPLIICMFWFVSCLLASYIPNLFFKYEVEIKPDYFLRSIEFSRKENAYFKIIFLN